MDLYLTSPLGPFPTAVGAAIGTFTARRDVSPSPLPVMAAGQPRLGAQLRISAEGEFSTTGTPTLALGFYIGTVAAAITTVIAESGVITTGTGAASWPWRLDYLGVFTALGTAGTLVGSGSLFLGTSLTAFAISPIPITLALRTITWDSTISRAIGVCATYGTSSASNTVKTNVLAAGLLN